MKKRQNDVSSFTADTAAKTGKSRRTVERDIALADKLDESRTAEAVRGGGEGGTS